MNLFRSSEMLLLGQTMPPLLISHLIAVVVYSIVGVFVLASCFFVIKKMMPFSITKEIEQDQNVALAIVLAAVILGMSMIISASIL